MHSISLPRLPAEILDYILSFLQPTDILKMKEVSSLFQDVFSASQYLQHRVDLFAEGLIDNPHVVCNLAERRERLREYVDRWKNPVTSTQYSCPLKNRVSASRSHPIGHHLFLARERSDSRVTFFTHLPSSPDQATVEERTLELPFRPKGFLASSKDGLLVVVEHETGSVNVHLLSLLDGSPHEAPLRKVLSLELGYYRGALRTDQQISGSRIALVVEFQDLILLVPHKELIVWNWRTGEVILKHSTNDTGSIGLAVSGISALYFLEESWLFALSRPASGPHLLVLNTQSPHSSSWRFLQLPQLPRFMYYSIPSQYERPSTEPPEFLVDPAQRRFAVFALRGSAIVIPVNLITRDVFSLCAEPRVTWDEWGKDTLRLRLYPDTSSLQFVGTKMLALCGSPSYPVNWGVEMYDLSKLGQKDIQMNQVSEGPDGVCRRVLSAPKWFARCQIGDEGGTPNNTYLVGNKVVCFYNRPSESGEELFLHVWKIG